VLLTPLPGTNRENLLQALRSVDNAVRNLRGGGTGAAQRRLADYLEWTTTAARFLGSQIRAADLAALVFTPGYSRLLPLAGTMTGDDMNTQRVLNALVSQELDQRVTAFEAAITALDAQVRRWSAYGHFVVPDTGFYIRHPEKLEAVEFGPLIDVRQSPVHVLVPIVVVDELDRLKEIKDRHVRWRAGYTLAVIDRVLEDPRRPGRLRAGDVDAPPGGIARSDVTMEIVFDPPGHVRLPIADDEIVDRCLAIEPLAGRKVTLLTYDTGQSTRARAAGLEVKKLTAQIVEESQPS
jgi:hypothetical protein